MSDQRTVAISRMNEVIEYLDTLRAAIDRIESSSRDLIASLQSGLTMADSLAAQGSGAVRQVTTDSFDQFARLRHSARLAMVALAISEGMTKADVSRAWGISPQWAGKLVAKAQLGLPPDTQE